MCSLSFTAQHREEALPLQGALVLNAHAFGCAAGLGLAAGELE